MQLIDLGRDDVSEERAEHYEQRLGSDGEDREMCDVAAFDLPLHLRVPGHEPLGLGLPERPVRVLRERAVAIANFNGVVFGRVSVWKDSINRSPVV